MLTTTIPSSLFRAFVQSMLAVSPARLMLVASIITPIVLTLVPGRVEAQTKTPVTVRLSFTASTTHSGIVAAKAKGWFDEAGLDATIGEGTGSASTAQLVAAGHDTFGLVNADVVIRLISTGSPIKMVSMPIVDSAYGILCRGDLGIKSPSDLVGHTFFDNAASTSYIQLPIFEKKVGVPLDKLHMQSVSSATITPGFMTGRYDCIGSLASQLSEYVNDKTPPIFFQYSKYGLPKDGVAIVANEKYIASNPDIVRKFVQASNRGYDWAFDHPTEMFPLMKAQFGNYAFAPQMTDAALIMLGNDSKEGLGGKPTGYIAPATLRSLSSMLHDDFGLTDIPAQDRLFTNEFVGQK